jgi:hypothetical protein
MRSDVVHAQVNRAAGEQGLSAATANGRFAKPSGRHPIQGMAMRAGYPQ